MNGQEILNNCEKISADHPIVESGELIQQSKYLRLKLTNKSLITISISAIDSVIQIDNLMHALRLIEKVRTNVFINNDDVTIHKVSWFFGTVWYLVNFEVRGSQIVVDHDHEKELKRFDKRVLDLVQTIYSDVLSHQGKIVPTPSKLKFTNPRLRK